MKINMVETPSCTADLNVVGMGKLTPKRKEAMTARWCLKLGEERGREGMRGSR